MTVTTYQEWLADGSPWHPAPCISRFAAIFESAGYTVYTIGDLAHLEANPPEDHTPYSHTAWPAGQPYPYVMACDIMPHPGYPDEWIALGQRIVEDKNAGVPGTEWIKYVNWTSPGGSVFHTSWEPGFAQEPSSDSGHIHISARSDRFSQIDLAGWNPLAAVRGGQAAALAVDGQLGPLTISRWQQIMGTPVDGVITQPPGYSYLVASVQRHLNSASTAPGVPLLAMPLTVDGQGICQDGHTVYQTTRALQKYLGTPQDGVLSLPTSMCVSALQTRLNSGRF